MRKAQGILLCHRGLSASGLHPRRHQCLSRRCRLSPTPCTTASSMLSVAGSAPLDVEASNRRSVRHARIGARIRTLSSGFHPDVRSLLQASRHAWPFKSRQAALCTPRAAARSWRDLGKTRARADPPSRAKLIGDPRPCCLPALSRPGLGLRHSGLGDDCVRHRPMTSDRADHGFPQQSQPSCC